jgi:hypothetical protein
MEEPQDPYAPPKSDISITLEKQGPDVKTVFSPAQGSLGSFFGGPLAGTYFVAMNFVALGAVRRAWLTTIWGIVITAASLLWHFFLPDRLLGYSIRIAYPVAAWLVIGRTQFTKPQIVASKTLTFHSNWRVAGVVLLGTLITFVLARVVAHLLSHG